MFVKKSPHRSFITMFSLLILTFYFEWVWLSNSQIHLSKGEVYAIISLPQLITTLTNYLVFSTFLILSISLLTNYLLRIKFQQTLTEGVISFLFSFFMGETISLLFMRSLLNSNQTNTEGLVALGFILSAIIQCALIIRTNLNNWRNHV